MNKWIVISLGGLLGLSHIGMIGILATRTSLPKLNLPVGEFTSYKVEASKDAYRIEYTANDPKVMRVERDVKKKAGFLGLGNNTYEGFEEYTVSGKRHIGGGVATAGADTAKKSIECIKAVGGGEQSGRLVGASVGAAVSPTLASVPFVGWVLAGAATMMGMDAGADIGGSMVEDLNSECQEPDDAI